MSLKKQAIKNYITQMVLETSAVLKRKIKGSVYVSFLNKTEKKT